jgi:prefoldin subunit 5
MADTLQTLQATFQILQSQVNDLRAACSPDDRKLFDAKYQAAGDAYWKYADEALTNNDAQVQALAAQLDTVNAWLANATKEMGNMSKVLDQIDKALTLGAQLAALAIAL